MVVKIVLGVVIGILLSLFILFILGIIVIGAGILAAVLYLTDILFLFLIASRLR